MLRFVQLLIRGAVLCLLFEHVSMVCLAQTVKRGADPSVQRNPPFGGTIFIDPDIITSSDPTTLQNVSYAGRGTRTMFDRRIPNYVTVYAYLFNVDFDDGLTAEIQVNPEFGSSDAALAGAQKNAPVIGRLPTVLRTDVQTVSINKGTEPFRGGNNNLLIHIGQADLYEADGILEETLVHEASHTSLSPYHAAASGWLAAQMADSGFISIYARDYPQREDIPESFLPYLAVRYRPDRITQSLYDTIVQRIPNRIAYFDNQSFNMYPIEPTGHDGDDVPREFSLIQNFPNPFNVTTTIRYGIPEGTYAHTSLRVFDVLGREVATLVNDVEGPGYRSVQWDASRQPSGVYFYRLQAPIRSGQSGDFAQTKKLVLVR